MKKRQSVNLRQVSGWLYARISEKKKGKEEERICVMCVCKFTYIKDSRGYHYIHSLELQCPVMTRRDFTV